MNLSKKELRNKFLKLKNENSAFKTAEIVTNILRVINSLKKSPDIIGIYNSIQQEPNILDIIPFFKNKLFALPKINNENLLEFLIYTKNSILIKNKFNILEPIEGNIVIPDIFIIPGVAFSKSGYRLGYGGGYYDRYFSERKENIIGICWHEQLIDWIPYESHDIKVKYIITDKGIY